MRLDQRLFPKHLGVLALASTLYPTLTLTAEEGATRIEDVIVSEERFVTPTKQAGDTVFTGTEITRNGMEVQGERAKNSVYEALRILPGISVESPDPYGLSAEHKNIRVRGVRGYLGSMTVEGIPNYGGNPMGPREYIYDMENMDGIAIYKGAIPADLGTGVGARGGAIELRPRWPQGKPGAEFVQGIGSDGYSRTFVRVSSPTIPGAGANISASYSHAEADKWKGPGTLGPRNNFNMALERSFGDVASFKLWSNYNELDQDSYKYLTYAQAKNLDNYYRHDYNEEITGTRSQDINFYKYNRGDYRNKDLFSIIRLGPESGPHLTFKPYYADEDTEILEGTTASGGLVQKRIRDIDRYGLNSEASLDVADTKISAGYLYESVDMEISTKRYVPRTLQFQGYGVISLSDKEGQVHSPYAKLAGKISGFEWQAGLKYFLYRDPASTGYTSPGPSFTPRRSQDLDREEKKYDAVLPSLGVSYDITSSVQIHGSYGRSQIRPYAYLPLINLYTQNRARFQAAGVTLDDLFDGYDMEISDNVEIGARFRHDHFEIMPVLFYGKHRDLLTTVYDPRVGLNYQQNVGKATGYGAEIEANVFLTDDLTLFINPSYTSLTYDEDLSFQGRTLDTDGRQIVDVPEWMLKAGLIFRLGGFEIVPMMRYIGTRYGDSEHRERIGSYWVADLKAGYTFKNVWSARELSLTLEIENLFDKKYVAVINSFDDARQGTRSYLAGAPFTAALTLGTRF